MRTTTKRYIFEATLKNGWTERIRALAFTKEEALQQVRSRNDIASYKYVGMERLD